MSEEYLEDLDWEGSKNGPSHESLEKWADDPKYLQTELYESFCFEWTYLYDGDKMELNIPPETSFGVTAGLKFPKAAEVKDDLNTASMYMAIKEIRTHYRECIEFGLYKGQLYFNKLFGAVVLKKKNLVQGINIVLVVRQDADKNSYATMYAVDKSGFVLDKLKIPRLLDTDWNGRLVTGAHFKSVRIEGFKPRQ